MKQLRQNQMHTSQWSLPQQAEFLVDDFGDALVGCPVLTQPMGDWPGGRAHITAICPDPECPDIVLQVSTGAEEIGIFSDEWIQIAITREDITA